MINYPALLSALLALCFALSLGIVHGLERAGYAEVGLRVLFFCLIALACLVGVIWCVLTNGGGIL